MFFASGREARDLYQEAMRNLPARAKPHGGARKSEGKGEQSEPVNQNRRAFSTQKEFRHAFSIHG